MSHTSRPAIIHDTRTRTHAHGTQSRGLDASGPYTELAPIWREIDSDLCHLPQTLLIMETQVLGECAMARRKERPHFQVCFQVACPGPYTNREHEGRKPTQTLTSKCRAVNSSKTWAQVSFLIQNPVTFRMTVWRSRADSVASLLKFLFPTLKRTIARRSI